MLDIGADAAGDGRRGLIELDLSGIPAGATIVSAELSMYMSINSNAPNGTEIEIEVHRITRSWLEGTSTQGNNLDGASWQVYDAVNPWDNAGGDFDPTVEAVHIIIQDETRKKHKWDITSLVQYWMDNPSENYGMLLKDSDEGTGSGTETFFGTFATMADGRSNRIPKVAIYYCN
jgi:hypothetical protein